MLIRNKNKNKDKDKDKDIGIGSSSSSSSSRVVAVVVDNLTKDNCGDTYISVHRRDTIRRCTEDAPVAHTTRAEAGSVPT